jgi:hypothetical protein
MFDSNKVVNRYLVAMAMKTRTIGTCGLCDQKVKCPNDKLAHHGYKRPGYGYIEGSCPGTGLPPIEISPATAEVGLKMFTERVDNFKNALKNLPSALFLLVGRGSRVEKVLKEDTGRTEAL